MADRSWSQTPDKVGKRKREKAKETATPTPAKTLKGKSKETPEERAPKRTRTSQSVQLPTPPTTGREFTPHLIVEPPSDIQEESEQRRGLRVTRTDEEGRKLAVGQLGEGELSPVETKPQRLTPAPTIITAETGVAALATQSILESELAWLENGGRPVSPTSPPVLRTPELAALLVEEEPIEKEDKVNKRLQAFSVTAKSEPMMCTRIDAFGRVAVRKDAAVKFLGIETSASLIEETKEEDEWVETSMAGSSKLRVKPSWPDELAPWSMAGGRLRKMREENEKAALLKRYLENSGDEDSDEELIYPSVQGKGKGKSVSRLIQVTAPDAADPRRQLRLETNADAKSALLTALRHRSLPSLPVSVVACACGARQANGVSPMVVCSNCKTWHHTICNGVDETRMNDRWWCPNCENQVLRMSTPAQTPRRAYTQSEERSSAFKGHADNIALAPSPIFMSTAHFSQNAPIRTPINRGVASPTSRNHRSRILSYGTDMWAYPSDDAGLLPTPSTPAPADARFTTPRVEDTPFDVTSTPSRHIDFNFGGPSLFSLTPLGGRSRIPSNIMSDTPLTYRHRMASQSDGPSGVGGRHDFLRDLAGPSTGAVAPQSPGGGRWPHALLGSSINPSSLGHRRTLSGNKMSSMRNSSRSGLGLGLPLGASNEDDDVGSAFVREPFDCADIDRIRHHRLYEPGRSVAKIH